MVATKAISAMRGFGGAVLLLSSLFIALMASPAYSQSLDKVTECGANLDYSETATCETNTRSADREALNECIDKKSSGSASEKRAECQSEISAGGKLNGLIKTILNVMSAIAGVIAVIMVIIGGFRYITSGGDSNSTSGAKNAIIYALVGLVIVAFAQVIVQFVLTRTT